MLKKIFVSALLGSFLLSSGAAQAYDLPIIKSDKVTRKASKSILKSDWEDAELFEQKLKARLASGKELAPNDPLRVPTDKNYVFIAFYNDAPYFLDKYSIKVKKDSASAQVWEQSIFPISKNFSPQNATSTHQKFCLSDGKIFNSKKKKDALEDLADEADRIFLEECFKVGYYFAFRKKVTGN
ncbi:MAG: hypothetical protein IKZ53_06630 [Selenomonadaceae bacterium]|nr:hypothetical protein [Selenomonadaceae bacterium]